MHSPARRWFSLSAALLLALPLLANLLLPAAQQISDTEQRTLAPMPAWPKRLRDVGTLPAKVAAYASDHFGLRTQLISLNAWLIPAELRPTKLATLDGQDGWMFLLNEDAIEQSRGELVRTRDIVRTADIVAGLHAALAARGIALVVASPPNSATIYADKLPDWARNPGQPTEYDAMLKALAERHVQTVDLRPVLRDARAQGDVYLHHDTHWLPRGALLAFNAIAAAMGHADWAFTPETSLGPATSVSPSDLARMSGDTLLPPELYSEFVLPDVKVDLEKPDYFASYQTLKPNADGRRVLIIGDSFTNHTMKALAGNQAAQMAWTFFNRCAFDWSFIARFKPDEVWLMPTERLMLCLPGAQPKGMPRE